MLDSLIDQNDGMEAHLETNESMLNEIKLDVGENISKIWVCGPPGMN